MNFNRSKFHPNVRIPTFARKPVAMSHPAATQTALRMPTNRRASA
ncbi:MAG: hypothetical protein QOD93_1822, partial [Acetobacteraceae bacterium]|nr:hypothetical protein [Acetobacteraceae bacterium]